MSHADTYFANYGGMAVADYVERHIRGSAAEMARMRRTVELVPPEARSVLDVGAGHGVFLEELKALRGIAGTGIEITPAKVDYARSRGVDLRLGNAAQLAFADGAFDAVVSGEVVEHLPFGTYEAALRELARVAARWVILTVPYDEQRRFVRCPYCSARVNPDYHFRAFPPGAMGALAAADALPGFALKAELALGEQRHSALLQLAKRLLQRWPRFLVCPACGFHEPEDPARATAAAAGPGGPADALAGARRAAAWVPARRKPQWLVGVFERRVALPAATGLTLDVSGQAAGARHA